MDMNWVSFTIFMLGGLAIFLYGMTVMTDGLKGVAGNSMKSFLKRMTHNRWTSLLAGMGITAVIQSSSITTVLAVGFVSAGLLSFQSTLGLILGAGLGTTITAQIIAFKVTHAAWIMIALGYLFRVIFAGRSFRDAGTVILGLGLVFLGMNVMGEATAPLKDHEPFIGFMQGMDHYVWGIIVGTLFTAAVQSSSATAGVVIVLAAQGLIPTGVGVAIILGANIGTCVTAVLSAIGKPRDAVRVAVSHVFFKVGGVLLWIAFIDQLAMLVSGISENDPARQIAHAHTIFNVVNAMFFIWLVGPVTRLILYLVPDKISREPAMFPGLHQYYLEDSPMALELSAGAIHKIGERALSVLEKGLDVALKGNIAQLEMLRREDEIIDKGHTEILAFLQQVQTSELSDKSARWLERQIEAVNILESAADTITTDLAEAAEDRITKGFVPSEATTERLEELYGIAVDSFRQALKSFSAEEGPVSEDLSKAAFKQALGMTRSHLLQRLSEPDDNRVAIYRVESEILEVIRRLHALARRLNRKAG